MKNNKGEGERNVGLYATIIFHLVLIIVLLSTSIHSIVAGDPLFEMDFSAQEAQEELERLEQMKEQATREVEELLAAQSASPAAAYRNIAVNRNAPLKDDRNSNPNVLDEARELQRKLDANRDAANMSSDDEVVVERKQDSNKKENQYKGPTVLSYSLDGRKATFLPVPVYKCQGGGDVSIRIVVNRKGRVIQAQIIESASVADDCITKAALDAAKRSCFNASSSAPEKQVGDIVYRFIQQ